MSGDNLADIVDVLKEISDDNTLPRNIKSKFKEICIALESSDEDSIKVNKALHELDEISNDTNLQPYVRTQIWNIVSMLESKS